jgi:hypothetical protein
MALNRHKTQAISNPGTGTHNLWTLAVKRAAKMLGVRFGSLGNLFGSRLKHGTSVVASALCDLPGCR